MKITAEPRSDQYNAEDFLGGPKTFTVAGVVPGKAEQKYDIQLAEDTNRVWRPPLTVLRLLMAAWTDDAAQWVGKRVTLYNDPTISFGKAQTGGIRISHLSGIDKPLTVNLTVTRGRRAPVTVQPLRDAPAPSPDAHLEALANAQTMQELQDAWEQASKAGVTSNPVVVAAKDARKSEILKRKQHEH